MQKRLLKLKSGYSKCSVCRQPFALPPRCLFCISGRRKYREMRRQPEPPAMPESRQESLEGMDRGRENEIICARLPRFRKIVKFKGRTLDIKNRQDFESQAMFYFYRSVRLHLCKWENGGNDKLLTAIAAGAFNWALKRRENRQKIIDAMGSRLR